MPRVTAECLALCGFELARQGQLREAAPVLRDALSAAAKPDAVAWTERFLSTVSSVDVRQWITSLATEMHEHAHLAEEYQALRTCAVAGLHDAKNLATSAYTELEILALGGDSVPPPVLAAKETAFRAARLAADVEQQIIEGKTQLILDRQPLDLRTFLVQQQETITRSAVLGRCALQVPDDLPLVQGDERYLTRVFGNLKSNAERYAPGADISLSARLQAIGRAGEARLLRGQRPGHRPGGCGDPVQRLQEPQRLPAAAGEPRHRLRAALLQAGRGVHTGAASGRPRPGQGAAFYFTPPVAT